jgi:hypothetical protein
LQLWGLPDIGDPFDVAAFRSFTIPDDRNAFVLYRQAARVFKPLRLSESRDGWRTNPSARWSEARPEFRRWVEENREALALFRRGAEMPDALDTSPLFGQGYGAETDALRSFQTLALLEASRLEEQGDMAGAWNWYRAALRTIHQVGIHDSARRRIWARGWHKQLRRELTIWVTDRRTTPTLLQHALDDVIACEVLVPSDSYMLKAEYLALNQRFEARASRNREVPLSWVRFFSSSDYRASPELLRALYDAWRFWRRENERSRRVIRLATANWLAFLDLPPEQRPRPDPDVTSNDFYAFGPAAPTKARALSPASLDRWLATTYDAQALLRVFDWRALRISEHADHRELLILLGTQLYRRDHGADPPSPDALVGPYLKHLPPEFPVDEQDETIPRASGAEIGTGQGQVRN